LLKQSPLGLDVGEILLALIFSAALFHQAILAPDTFHSGVTNGQIEVANQAARSEGGKDFAQPNELGFD
jgi:hypothetical protein